MNTNLKKDGDLINALKKGDDKAYTHLVNQYHHKLCVYAYSLTKDHQGKRINFRKQGGY